MQKWKVDLELNCPCKLGYVRSCLKVWIFFTSLIGKQTNKLSLFESRLHIGWLLPATAHMDPGQLGYERGSCVHDDIIKLESTRHSLYPSEIGAQSSKLPTPFNLQLVGLGLGLSHLLGS